MDAISNSNVALKNSMSGYDAEKVQEIMDDVNDGIQDSEEIGNVLARGLGGDDIMEDDELLAEFNELEQEDLQNPLLKNPGYSCVSAGILAGNTGEVYMPEAPSCREPRGRAPEEEEDEEDEDWKAIRELEAFMTPVA